MTTRSARHSVSWRHRRGYVSLVAAALALSIAPVTSAMATSVAAESSPVALYRDPHRPVEQRVADLLGRMTLAEKVGQMTQAERAAATTDKTMVGRLGLGSVLSGGGSVPATNTAQEWADTVDDFQRQALNTRLGIPIIYGVDAVHGHNNLYGATIFPHNIGLGATRDPDLVEQVSAVTAQEVRATGIPWNFAPCICVTRDARWGRSYESFGEDPHLVSVLGKAAVVGLQGRNQRELGRNDRVLATVKHFAGDGDTEYDTPSGDYTVDQGITITSRRDFERIDLAPYLPRHPQRGRRQCDALVLQRGLDRGRGRQSDQDAPEHRTHHRCAQGQDGPGRLRHHRLGGHSPDSPATTQPGAARSRTPASTCSWNRPALLGAYAKHWQLAMGGLIIAIVLILPHGIGGLIDAASRRLTYRSAKAEAMDER